MPKPGPKTTPTALKKLKGGRRTYHQPMPKDEPMPEKTEKPPGAPRHLDKVGKKEWRRMAKELHALGLLTKIDLVGLAAYCSTYALWLKAQAQIQTHGVLIKAQSGFPMQSPYLQISNKAMEEMRKWLVEFGMTPSSRSRVSVKPKEKKDPRKEFLDRGGKLKAVT